MAKKKSKPSRTSKSAVVRAARRGKPAASPLAALGNLLSAPLQADIAANWRYLLWLLGLAWVLRVAVGVSGDFVIHPDEIMQYLEPAHRLVFGAGVSYWEFYFGARSWLTPSFVALWLAALDAIGLAQPAVYIAVVKMAFCALSLLAPYGMYKVGQHLYNEKTARIALLLGVFWYELVGFAHKPMTEFVATPLIMLLLAWITDPRMPALRGVLLSGALAVLIVAVRFQYAPVVAVMMLFYFIRLSGGLRIPLVAVGAAAFLAVGFFDYLSWAADIPQAGFLHSYWVNLQVNLVLGGGREGESAAWIFLLYLAIASGGCFLLAVWAARDYKQHRLLLWLIGVTLIIHSLQSHREYRFIFTMIPFYLILFAHFISAFSPTDSPAAASGGADNDKFRLTGTQMGFGGFALIVSLLGILNFLPLQNFVYRAFSQEKGIVNFVRGQDPIFEVYRDLARDPQVAGVWDSLHTYFNTGGYYYLHHSAPFYDAITFHARADIAAADEYVSHIITGPPRESQGVVRAGNGRYAMRIGEDRYLPLPSLINDESLGKPVYWNSAGRATPVDGFEEEATYGDFTVWRRTDGDGAVRQWSDWVVYPDNEPMYQYVDRALGGEARAPTADAAIVFVDEYNGEKEDEKN